MINKIKNWFKKETKELSVTFHCRSCGLHVSEIKSHYTHTCELSKELSLVEKTFAIFKATKFYPEIAPADREAFFNDCKELCEDEVLDRVIDEIVTEYAEDIIQNADNEKILLEKRNRMLGADQVRLSLLKYANSKEQKEEFNKFETI